MDFGTPSSFYATGGMKTLAGQITTPDTLRVVMNFEQCPVIWQHRLWGTGDLNTQFNNGVFFYGEKATLFASDNRLIMMPAGRDKQQEIMDISTAKMQENHVADFINAVKEKNKKLLSCTIEDAFQSTATVQLGMIAYSTGNVVKWDSNTSLVIENKPAAQLLARPYRDGYQRPKA